MFGENDAQCVASRVYISSIKTGLGRLRFRNHGQREACKQHAEQALAVHAASCGSPLPTPATLMEASVEEVLQQLREFGAANPMLADCALESILGHAEASGFMSSTGRIQLTSTFAASEGFECLVSMMHCRPREEALQARCCMAIAAMAEGEDVCQHASNAGVFAAVVGLLLAIRDVWKQRNA